MTLTIDLTPEIEAKLREKASGRGQDIGSYLLDIACQDSELAALSNSKKYKATDFAGIGAKYATGQDAQEYVNELRAEWDHRP
jgi:hypothetical protein